MEKQTNTFDYTRKVLATLTQQARNEIKRLGGNSGVEAILEKLVVKEGAEPELEKPTSMA